MLAILALLILVLVDYPWLMQRVKTVPPFYLLPVIAGTGICAIMSLPVIDFVPMRWQKWRAVRPLVQIGRASRKVLLHASLLSIGLPLSAAGIVTFCASVYFLARSLDVAVTWLDCMLLVPPVILAAMLPITVGGWGVREITMVVLFGAIGIASDAALALSILVGLVAVLVSLGGGVLWLRSPPFGHNEQ